MLQADLPAQVPFVPWSMFLARVDEQLQQVVWAIWGGSAQSLCGLVEKYVLEGIQKSSQVDLIESLAVLR